MKFLITAVYEGNPEDKYSYTPGGIQGIFGPNDYNSNPFNYIVLGKLENDIDIEIRTYEEVSKLKNYISKTINCLLLPHFFMTQGLEEWIENGLPLYRGKVVGEYLVGSDWKNRSEWKDTVFFAIDTKVGNKQIGMFLLIEGQLERASLNIGQEVFFTTYSYDIIAWNPLKRE